MFEISKKPFLYLKNHREFKNIAFSFVFRAGATVCNFLIVPLLIDQLSATEYGILITIISISSWFTFVDLGLANGLRNKISQSLAQGDVLNVRKYITSAYYALLKVVVVLSFLLIICNYFIDWNKLIKGPQTLNNSINIIFFYGLLLFFARILAELINPILIAYHKTAVSSFIAFIAQLAILAISFLFVKKGSHSFVLYGLLFFWIPLLVYAFTNIYFYLTSLKQVRPSGVFFQPEFQKALFKLGASFFIIQIAYLIIFMTDNLIIGRIFSYKEVSVYNIAYRYFNIPLFVLSIILMPYWAVFAECYSNNESARIKKIIKKLLLFWLLIAVVAVFMLLFAKYAYSIWVGKKIVVPFVLNLGMCLFCIISGWNSVFATFINSTSKLKLQLYSSIIIGILNIPLSIFLAKHTLLGPAGVIFGTCACLLIGSFWAPIQYLKLINNKAKGIWNK